MITVDPELKITEMNPRAELIIGCSEKEALGKYCGEILKGEMCGKRCPLKTILTKRKPLVRLETTIHPREDILTEVRLTTSGLYDEKGDLIGGVEVIQDISELKALERERANIISMFCP